MVSDVPQLIWYVTGYGCLCLADEEKWAKGHPRRVSFGRAGRQPIRLGRGLNRRTCYCTRLHDFLSSLTQVDRVWDGGQVSGRSSSLPYTTRILYSRNRGLQPPRRIIASTTARARRGEAVVAPVRLPACLPDAHKLPPRRGRGKANLASRGAAAIARHCASRHYCAGDPQPATGATHADAQRGRRAGRQIGAPWRFYTDRARNVSQGRYIEAELEYGRGPSRRNTFHEDDGVVGGLRQNAIIL